MTRISLWTVLAWYCSFFLVASTFVAAETGNADPSLNSVRRRTQDLVRCHIFQVDVELPELLAEDEGNDTDKDMGFVCWTDSDQVWDVQVSTLAQVELLLELDGMCVTISHASASVGTGGATLTLSPESEISVVEEDAEGHRRHLAPSQGTSLVLVLRVTYRGTGPTLTASQLAGRVFGLGSNAESVNLASQTRACSFGKLKLVAASGHDNIVDGVLQVDISQTVTGDNSARSLENLVVAEAARMLGWDLSRYQHVMMVFPSHGDIVYGGRSFLAYGYVGASRTVFNNEWAGRLSAVAHEFGHNYKLSHSGKGTDNYGDMSGFMGYGSRTVGGPLSCYNAQKHWDLGWMSSNAKALTVSDLPWGGNLAAFVDMPLTDSPVVLRIQGSNQRLFLQYNRKKGMNAGTRELGDQVVIVKDDGNDNQSGRQSWQLGGVININAPFRRSSFSGGFDLVIEVCKKVTTAPEFVNLSIYLDNGVQKSTCSNARLEATCQDSVDKKFYVQQKNTRKSCAWLRKRPLWQERLCYEGHEAYSTCSATCRAGC